MKHVVALRSRSYCLIGFVGVVGLVVTRSLLGVLVFSFSGRPGISRKLLAPLRYLKPGLGIRTRTRTVWLSALMTGEMSSILLLAGFYSPSMRTGND